MAVAPIEGIAATVPQVAAEGQLAAAGPQRPTSSFADLLAHGVDQVDRQVLQAEGAVRAFLVDDSLPVHQVTYALEHARLSFELMMQVRTRLVEGYQELMRMQL